MKTCKHCGFNLRQDVLQRLIEKCPEKTRDQCLEYAKQVGWSEEKPVDVHLEIGINDICIADGIIYWICPQCEKILKKGPYWQRYVQYMAKEGETVEDPGE